MTSTATREAAGNQFAQNFQPLCHQLAREKIDARQVAARAGEAGDETELDRVLAGNEYDRDCRCCRLGRQCNVFSGRGDHHDLAANQIGRKFRQSVVLIFGQSVNDRHVLALDIADLFEALAEPAQTVR